MLNKNKSFFWKTVIKAKFLLLYFLIFRFELFAQSLDAYWTLVFAGENVTNPVFWRGNIYTAGKDRALNCITSDGKFLWRRNTKEMPSQFISVSNSGLVYLISEKGNLEVFSSQGMPAWQYISKQKPIFPVHTAKDGRSFIIYSNSILCLTPKGKLKWKLPISSAPIAPPVETGSKDIILILKSGDFVRVSIFGEIVEQYRLKKNILAIGEVPSGYILADSDGNISYFKVGIGSESVWQWNEIADCAKIYYENGKVLYLFKNGKAICKTLYTNEFLWEIQTKGNFSGGLNCRMIGNEFNISDLGYGCLMTDSGRLKWEKNISEKPFLPVITENGLLVGITKEFLNAYRMEIKLTRRGKTSIQKRNDYSILDDTKEKKFTQEFPFFIEYTTVREFLKIVEDDIKNATVGTKEPRYAFQLKTILENKRKASYTAQDFTSFDRATAAEFLGQLGSYEYREILLAEIAGDGNETVLAGIVKGLTHLAYDPDGKTIDGLKIIMKKAKYDSVALMKTVIECLETLIRYGDKKTAKEAVLLIFSVLKGPYSEIIQNYARQKIKNIV